MGIPSAGDVVVLPFPFSDFESGMLRLQSYARPAKLFTANEGLIISIEGTLKPEKLNEIR